jgi:flavin reductase (DIM6/NTAB) family NADH-FMN oxidoreductase RutF
VKKPIPLNQALRLIVPGVVGLVTAEYRGRFDVTTISWLAPVGREPPLLALAVHPSTMIYDMIKRSGEFVINVPTMDVIKQVMTCGTRSGNDVDKFAQTGLEMAEPRAVRAPLIEQCVGHLECAVINALQPGDHTIFIGQVAYAWAEEEAFDEFWRLAEKDFKPLHHLGGSFFATLDERYDAMPKEQKTEKARAT